MYKEHSSAYKPPSITTPHNPRSKKTEPRQPYSNPIPNQIQRHSMSLRVQEPRHLLTPNRRPIPLKLDLHIIKLHPTLALSSRQRRISPQLGETPRAAPKSVPTLPLCLPAVEVGACPRRGLERLVLAPVVEGRAFVAVESPEARRGETAADRGGVDGGEDVDGG
ncbi:unnamed protein product [Periconia digitata]|uniref:Uncharacterized protein n=1 Tax=Periconia digitata TaxID=1303443 RepID=A0A9W4UU61_9PLEO|nr:unnamed protein product [Periconia digitata]